MEIANKLTYYMKIMSAYVVNAESSDDPAGDMKRVQIFIPEMQPELIYSYEEYMNATGSKKDKGEVFSKYPWAFNTVTGLANGDLVYVSPLNNTNGNYVIIGKDAASNGTNGVGGGVDGALEASGLAEVVLPFLIHHECPVHYHLSSSHNSKYNIVPSSEHNPLYTCIGWADKVPDIVLGCYTTSTSSSWSVGLLNWDASRAYALVYDIACKDYNWESYFSDKNDDFVKNLKHDVSTGNCRSSSSSVYQTGRTSVQSKIDGIQKMLTSNAGREVQISKARTDVTNYLQGLMDEGMTNPAILIYMADLCNQWGTGQPSSKPYLGKMHKAAVNPSTIMSSVSTEVENAIKGYNNANQMMKEVEALHAYWMGPLHNEHGMNRYESRRNECIVYIRELFKQGKLSQFAAGMTMLGELRMVSYKGVSLAYPFITELSEQTQSATAYDGKNAYSYKFTMQMPTNYPITSLFGARYIRAQSRVSYHNGVDFGCPRGTVLYASHEGTLEIKDSGSDGYGYHAIITFKNGEDTWKVYYGHMITGSSNQYGYVTGKTYDIKAGQPIGQVNTTGSSTGNHLHYELRRNGNYVNPLPYMGLGNEHFPILSGMSNYLLE